MHAALLWAAALRRLLAGPPLTGPRIVIPLPAALAGRGAHLELGFVGGHPAVRIVLPGQTQPSWSDPSWADPDADLGPHDAWAKF